MKKIIAIILALACVFAFVSCDNNTDEVTIEQHVANTSTKYQNSDPTRIEMEYSIKLGATTLSGEYLFQKGLLDVDKNATVEDYTEQTLASVEDGATENKTPETKSTNVRREYVDGKGVRTITDSKASKWDGSGVDFAPQTGAIAAAMNLDFSKLSNVTYENGVLSFVVPLANVVAVFGESCNSQSDVSVTIKDDGAVITEVTVAYTIVNDDTKKVDYPDGEISMTVKYSYGIESITLYK